MKTKKGLIALFAVFVVLVVCYLALKMWNQKREEEEQKRPR